MAPFCSVAVFGRPAVHTLLSVVLHIAVAACFLDDLFSSSMRDVGQLRPHQSPAQPLASRVVLISIDSATADVLFSGTSRQLYPSFRQGDDSVSLPFLSTVLRHACWGVKHVTGPTETRPTHVEMLAGVPEDPASVRTGWRHSYNSSYDTVLKGATHAWQWAYEDVLADTPDAPHIHSFVLPKALEVYPHGMDQWVSDSLAGVLAEAQRDPAKKEQLAAERGVFFLHFLGLDSMGHHFGADSWEYAQKLEHVDACVKRAKEAFDQYFPDGRTAFIITSDHGMAGTRHGGGSPVETRTPFIVFGAGANEHCSTPTPPKRRVVSSRNLHRSEEEEVAYVSKAWGLDPQGRMDIAPADVSMLMASLLSSPLPVHSEGTVPIEYMSTDRAARAHAMFTNVLQARERVQGAAAVRRSRCHGWFSEWGGAGEAEAMFAALSQHMEGRDYEAVLQRSGGLVELLHEGALYYREYDKALMLAAVAFAYTVWALYSVAVVASETTGITAPQRGFSALPLVLGYALVLPVVHVQGMAWRDACYLLAPCHILPFIWLHSARAWQFLRNTVTSAHTATAAIGVTSVILGFHQRWVFSIAFALLAGGLHCTTQTDTATKLLVILTGAFTLLPCVGSDFLAMVSPAGVVLSLCFYIFLQPHLHTSFRLPWMLWFAAALLTGLTDYIRSVSADGLPLANQAAAWCILLASMALPRLTLHTVPPDHRLAYTLLCLQPPMALLSVGYEPLFLGILSLLLHRTEQVSRQLQLSVSTQAVLLLLLVYYAFFATGNIASVSSFDLPSVYRLQTHFDKGIMGALLIFKLWLPLLALTSTVLFLCRGAVRSVFSVVALTVALSDLVALAFFVTLRNTGSWKQIGHSISRYVIANLLTLILLLLWGIASLYVGTGPKAKRT